MSYSWSRSLCTVSWTVCSGSVNRVLLSICKSFRVGSNQSGLILHSAQSIPVDRDVLLRISFDETNSFRPVNIVPIVTAPTIDLTCLATRKRSAVVTHVPSSIRILRTFDRTGSDSRAPFNGARFIPLSTLFGMSLCSHGSLFASSCNALKSISISTYLFHAHILF